LIFSLVASSSSEADESADLSDLSESLPDPPSSTSLSDPYTAARPRPVKEVKAVEEANCGAGALSALLFIFL